jgi:hypothetical protein
VQHRAVPPEGNRERIAGLHQRGARREADARARQSAGVYILGKYAHPAPQPLCKHPGDREARVALGIG